MLHPEKVPYWSDSLSESMQTSKPKQQRKAWAAAASVGSLQTWEPLHWSASPNAHERALLAVFLTANCFTVVVSSKEAS